MKFPAMLPSTPGLRMVNFLIPWDPQPRNSTLSRANSLSCVRTRWNICSFYLATLSETWAPWDTLKGTMLFKCIYLAIDSDLDSASIPAIIAATECGGSTVHSITRLNQVRWVRRLLAPLERLGVWILWRRRAGLLVLITGSCSRRNR